MASETVQFDRNVLDQVASRFGKLAQSSQQLLQMLNQLTQTLRTEWLGEAATSYHAEWEQDIQPAYTRLIEAFNTFQSTTNEIKKTFEQHEEEAAGIFKAWQI